VNQELHDLGAEYWEWQLETNPTSALMLGDHRFDSQFEQASREAEDAEIAALRRFADAAEAIDPSQLTADEGVSRELMMFEASTKADELEMRWAELAVNHTIGLQAMIPVTVPQLPILEAEHAYAMIDKYEAYGVCVSQMAERLQEGVANGRTPPQYPVDATIVQLDTYLASSMAEDPHMNLRVPADLSDEQTAEWRAELARVITDHVRPAWETYRDVLANEVLPVARPMSMPGACGLPNGDEIYRRAIRRHTSVELTAEQIHQIGLDQIAKLDEEYRQLGSEVLGTSSLEEIYATLRDDPTLHFREGPAIVAASEAALAKATAVMGDWFGRLPKAPCVVKEVATGPTAFYHRPAADGSRPGTFFINTADPTRWHTFEIEAMAYHEGIPGHHLQLAIAGELEDTPEFRKHAQITAYAEGWGLYTERLADEMGLYSGPLERIGMLSADSMRASRLVVDTGLHVMEWSREQAIEFFLDNSPMTRTTVEGEVDRYIGWPGQALAYMIGRLEIMKYRQAAMDTMGDRFDIKGFHDVVLGSGLVPLPTLERMVAEWAAAG